MADPITIETNSQSMPPVETSESNAVEGTSDGRSEQVNNYGRRDRKRKRDFGEQGPVLQGGRGRRDDKRSKKGDLGREQYL